MKKTFRKSISLILVVITLLSTLSVFAVSASAASYPTNYSSYDQPESSDFARWNGSKVVKGSGTNKNEIKWMQAAINYCIANRGLKASYLTVDGSFGPSSKKATIEFQKAYGLTADGSFGPATIAKMKTVLSDRTLTVDAFNTVGLIFNANGGTMSSTRMTVTKGQAVTMPYATQTGKTLLGWTNDRSGKTATYKPGCTYTLDWTTSPFFYAVWGDFEQHNFKQINESWSKAKAYNGSYLSGSGCGIMSMVNAVYNLTGGFIDPIELADWAYANKYFNQSSSGGGGICNRNVFKKVADKYGDKYGFEFVGSAYAGASSSTLKEHIQNGGTAIVHVPGHFMCIVDYNAATGQYLVFDPAPNAGRRVGLTAENGSWKTVAELSTGNIKIDAFYLYGLK